MQLNLISFALTISSIAGSFSGIEPFSPKDYEPVFSTSKGLAKTYSSYWGRSAAVQSILGTYAAIPVQVSSVSYSAQGMLGFNSHLSQMHFRFRMFSNYFCFTTILRIGVIPRQVILNVQYYQVTAGTKRLVTASVAYPGAHQCVALTSGGMFVILEF